MIVKAIYSAVQKFCMVHHILKKVCNFTGIRHITSAFACDKQLLAKLFILFNQDNILPCTCGSHRSHHSRRTTAYNYDICHTSSYLFLRRDICACNGILSISSSIKLISSFKYT